MLGLRRTRSASMVVVILVFGFLAISLMHLMLTIATSQAVYELSDLKREKRELDTTSQILSEEVSSLASHQNLLNSAAKLGMVANSNPVFLNVEAQKVFGKPKPAPDASTQSRNLVANSVMIKQTVSKNKSQVASIAEPEPIDQTVAIGEIPASPTR